MKATETKTTTSSRQQHQSSNQTPFFQKEGEGNAFFSATNKANIQRSPFHNEVPFFQPAPQLKSQSGGNIQAKLTIGQSNDKYEKEADATADEVVQRLKTNVPPQAEAVESSKVSIQRKCNTCGGEIEEKHGQAKEIRQTKFTIQKKPIFESNGSTDLDIQRSPTPAFTQRKCADCEQKEKLQRKEEETAENSLEVNRKPIFDSNEPPPEENTIQAKTENEGITASSNLQSRLNSSKGSGQPLSSNTQNAMSTAIGADFSNVRVHTDSNAVQMSRELGAQAFTHGSDIYFNQGKYNPSSSSGQHLLAHELTHTVQQGKSIQKKEEEKPLKQKLKSSIFSGVAELEEILNNKHKAIGLGAAGEYVARIQKALIYHGFDLGTGNDDGKYGKKTFAAVKTFQKTYKFINLIEEVDGIVGQETLRILDEVMLFIAPKEKDEIIKTFKNQSAIVKNNDGVNMYKIPVRRKEDYEKQFNTLLPQNTKLKLLQEISGGWYKVKVKYKKSVGYINKNFVETELPHYSAYYYKIEGGTAIRVATKLYKGISVNEDDLRDYVDYLVFLNKGQGDPSKGIYKPNATDNWDKTKVKKDNLIWVTPSKFAYEWVKKNGKYAGHNVVFRTVDEAFENLLKHGIEAKIVEALEQIPLEERAKAIRTHLREQTQFLIKLRSNSQMFTGVTGLIGAVVAPGMPSSMMGNWQAGLFKFAISIMIGRNEALLDMNDEELDGISFNLLKAQTNPEYYYGFFSGIGKGIVGWFVGIGEMVEMLAKVAYFFTPMGMTHWMIENQDKIEGAAKNIAELASYIEENKQQIIASFKELSFSEISEGLEEIQISVAKKIGRSIAQEQLNFSQKAPYEIGTAVGKIMGYIIPEIILAVFSSALGNLVKGVFKVLSKILKLITKAGKYLLKSLAKLRKLLGFIDEILDIFKGIKLAGSKNPFVSKLDDFFQELKKFFTKKSNNLSKIDDVPIKQLKAELEAIRPSRIKKSSNSKFDVEIVLDNGHTWKRGKNGKWCRFSKEICYNNPEGELKTAINNLDEITRRVLYGGDGTVPQSIYKKLPSGHPDRKAQRWIEFQLENPQRFTPPPKTKIDPIWSKKYDQIIENSKSGGIFEKESLDALKLDKNNHEFLSPGLEKGGFIPDSIIGNPEKIHWGESYDLVEIKGWENMSNTGNLKAMLEYVKSNNSTITAVFRSDKHPKGATKISEPLQNILDALVASGKATIVRRP